MSSNFCKVQHKPLPRDTGETHNGRNSGEDLWNIGHGGGGKPAFTGTMEAGNVWPKVGRSQQRLIHCGQLELKELQKRVLASFGVIQQPVTCKRQIGIQKERINQIQTESVRKHRKKY